jgi:acetoin utilization protein AcuC
LANSNCKLGISFGEKSFLYSFPDGHPMNARRIEKFSEEFEILISGKTRATATSNVSVTLPSAAKEEDLLLFHAKEYVEFVKQSSRKGTGYLDYGDTPSFPGVYEASLLPVGSTLEGLAEIAKGTCNHFFNPVGGLHHARRDRAGGFCVFNDAAIAICKAMKDLALKKVAYVDIDAHHGDGVYYGFEEDPSVVIGDIHEDGRFLYPGTGSSSERGKGVAEGTKLNIPLPPGSGDESFFKAFDKIADFVKSSEPDFIFLQCGADGLRGDPLTHLEYSKAAHAFAARRLHELSHEFCDGRLLAMGGGGYNKENVSDAWLAVISELSSKSEN